MAAEIIRSQDRAHIDYLARDFDSLLQSMRGVIPTKLPEWTDFESPADFGNVLLQLFAHLGDILSYYQDRVATESFLGTAQSRRSVIHHLRLIGYRLATAAPASAALTLSLPGDFAEIIEIARGDAFATTSQKERPSVRFEYAAEEPLVVDFAVLPVDAASGRKLVPGVPVEEGRLVRAEFLGTSDGTPNQRFALAQPGLILRAKGPGREINRDLIVTSELGAIRVEWTLQESLAFSRQSQTDFVVEIDENDRAEILFGDGQLGAVPPNGAAIAATYRVGGGLAGNVPAGTITTVVDAPRLALAAARASNPAAATGGAPRETLEHAVAHAPSVFRSLQRAVTGEDFEALALDFAGVGKVRAEATNWNTVTLYVAPAGGGQVSDVLEANLLAYFEDKRPLSTIIEIEDVDYVSVFVSAEVGVKSYHSQNEVAQQVRLEAGGLLSFDRVDFGQTLYLSKVYEAIEAIEGVEFVNVTEFRREGGPPGSVEPLGKIELAPSELARVPVDPPYAGGIRVAAKGGF